MEDFSLIIFFIIMFIIFVPMINSLEAKENIANYPISEAILIDNFISYSRFGDPCYYLIYKFNDNSIKEFKVTEEQYYKNINNSWKEKEYGNR